MASKYLFKYTLTCKPYVKAYLRKKFKAKGQLVITRDNEIGKFFYELIDKDEHEEDKKYRQYQESIVFLIGERLFFRKGYWLTPTNITKFNNFVEDMAKTEMRAYVTALVDDGGKKLEEAFKKFSARYGFTEDDWSFDAMKKDYYRYTRKEESIQLAVNQ